MSRRRALSRVLLENIAAKLADWPDPARSRFTLDEVEYLRAVCATALADGENPLGVDRKTGGQDDRGAELLREAKLVHKHIQVLGTLRAACEAVGVQLHRDGSKSGSVEKNYKRHREMLRAADRFYGALNRGEPPSAEDVSEILKGK